jgi:hypothetical protein
MPNSKLERLLGKEFGCDRITDEPGGEFKAIKDRVKKIAGEMDLEEDTINHFSKLRKNGKVAIVIPYRNHGEQSVTDLLKLRSRSFQVSERAGRVDFDLFSMDVGNESGKASDWVFKASRMLPEVECNDIKRIAKEFYSHNVYGYFAIIDDPDLSDREVTLLALFYHYYIKERFNLHAWMCAVDTSTITDKMIMSPYVLKPEKVI